ncbi:hypothetical protein Tsubulata_011069 [Turnera subulata]|uniref:Fe2OG dioxygenase domain-containing protein n=1 Tax=Turnera subulata TaxID=218843 RepID=A0A9Q0FBN8_9ROSI|nr:hypothetical protein Tsubulata_011069 [Turnera subulata]
MEVDPAFIQTPEHRPKLEITKAEGIPIIDLSILNSPDTNSSADLEGLVKEVGEACKKWGFFQIINHGVSLEKRQKIENASRKFFALPLEEKRKVRRNEEKVMGYYDTEHTKNVRDWKEDPTLVPASFKDDEQEVTKWYNQWPEHPPELREACQEYAKEVEKLAFKLMELIALSLGLPANRFHSFFKEQTTYVRLNHYPPCPSPHLALGVGRHKDAGALTILAQDDVGGLEVKRKSDGEWIWVEPTPDAYIINVGDIIQVWSNDAYESVEHRVMVNSERERFSIPFFFHPAHYTDVKPLEELTNELNPAKYRPYRSGKFVVTRKRSNFMKLDVENIQIYHFRIPDSELAEKLEQGLSIKPKLEIVKAEGIPLIDLSILNSPDSNYSPDPHALEDLVKEVGNACKKWGFFQIINHGVSLEKRQKIEDASRKFFALPIEEKREVRKSDGGSLGYSDTEHTKNVRDWKEVFDFTVEDPTLIPASYEPDDKGIRERYNQWPEHPSELREACEEYAKEVEKLAYKLMELIALSLGLPGNRFHPFFKDQTTYIRLNHYPPCPSPHLALGLGRHKDSGALTILCQDDVGGLQVKRKSDGEWIWVKPTQMPLSSMLVWSNDAYESVEHRVMVNYEKERFSIPFFFHPAHYTDVKPLEELTNEANPAKYRPYNWGKFLVTRKRSNFTKLNVENIQVYHFRIPDSELAKKLEQGLSIK